ncbi:hypothetical protein L6164_035515 [Bauhinia variegata]|uniref:Uncharacterized protein n=1 Tax=Bauhinia variegata TaxID=167791 RepID=A0ACB9KEA9_BAUVA|nr:hypothetical protein L6164_035515 [Bauhinia variegata]
MAKAPYLGQDSIKSSKPKGLSFFASILSLFVYIYIFYFFNLSPSTVFNNTIFWFLMSNTLILIIAADYGAFSSSKEKQDIYLYEEYVKHSRVRNYVPLSYVPRYQEVEEKHIIDVKKAELGCELLQENNNKETIAAKSEVPERVLEIVVQNDPKKPSDVSVNEKRPALPLQIDHSEASEKKPIPERALRRCKSDRHDRNKRMVIDESKSIVRRSETMKMDEGIRVEEENEFSSMTNEELNRRAEEFIQRFNRQIRLQAAARNMHQIC